MDMGGSSNNNNHNHDIDDLPPFPTAAGINSFCSALTVTAPIFVCPQNSHPICQPLGLFSSTPQSYFFTTPTPTPTHEQQQQPPPSSHDFPPYSFLSSSSSYPFTLGNDHQPTKNINTNPLFPKDLDGRRVLDAWSTKVARTKRRLARQRTLTLTRSSSSSTSSSSSFNNGNGSFGCSSDEYSTKALPTHFPNSDSQTNNHSTPNLFTFCTPDNQIILRMLLKKELKNSDVGSLGRIVLPKREAEENLPSLSDKEGIQVVIRDVNSHRKWAMKYKYWANNRSRMYVLENTGDFVRQNGLVIGDSITLYEDECKNLYVSIKKGENHSSMEENERNQCTTAAYTNMDIKDEEEEASLALLIEELKHKTTEDELQVQQPLCNNNNNNNLIVSQNYSDLCFERSGCYISTTRRPSNGKEVEDNLQNNINGFEDCFGGLDTLPEVSGFKFPLFDYLNSDRT